MRNRLAICAAAGLALASGATATAAPAVPAVPGLQTERFRLVLEGDATAIQDLDLGGSNGICVSDVNVRVTEKVTWRRGRGVVLQFMKLGPGSRAPIVMTRVGNPSPSFTVKVAATRTSSGAASRTPAVSADQCPPLTEDLATGPDCGKPSNTNAVFTLSYTGGNIRLRQTGLGIVSDIACPVSTIYGGTPEPKFAWPNPVPLKIEPIPRSVLFGTRKVILVHIGALRKRVSTPIASGPLAGNVTDIGQNKALLRLIRIG